MAIEQQITPFGTAPSTSDPVNFDPRADATMESLEGLPPEINTFSNEANALAEELNNKLLTIGFSYVWATQVEKDAEVGMTLNQKGYQSDVQKAFNYNGASWVEYLDFNTFKDSLLNIANDIDSSKKIVFDASNITTATSRVLTMKDADLDLNDVATNLPYLLGIVTFTNALNNINLIGIGNIGLEIGDVIVITDSVSNNKEFTVEVLTDSDNIIVNEAHAGGITTKSLIDEVSTANVTITLLSKYFNASSGLGQGWVNILANRASNVLETNITNREIKISVKDTSHAGSSSTTRLRGTVEIDGEETIDTTSLATFNTLTLPIIVVPKGSDYKVIYGGSFNPNSWYEER